MSIQSSVKRWRLLPTADRVWPRPKGSPSPYLIHDGMNEYAPEPTRTSSTSMTVPRQTLLISKTPYIRIDVFSLQY